MKKKHYAIAMGEEGIDNLQEHEDAYAKQRSYEDYEHGTGVPSYYDEDSYGYNYQDSNPLTDIDYQPGNDESSVFTDNYTGTEDYDPVARDDEEESDDEDFDDDDEDFDGDGGNFNGDDEEDEEIDNTEDNLENGEGKGKEKDQDEDSDEVKKEYSDGENVHDKKNNNEVVNKHKNQHPKIDPYDGVIKWHPGDPITIGFLAKTWSECAKIPEVRSFMDVANTAVNEALNMMGPNMMLKLNKYIEKLSDSESDMIGSLLKLIASNGKRLTFITVATIEAFFDQQWMQVGLLAGLPTALQAALNIPAVNKILNGIFAVSVPIINRKFSMK